jgi:ABC-type microcin C transport system permease subunit YejE
MKLGFLGFKLIYPHRCCILWSLNLNIRACAIELSFLGAMQGCFGFNFTNFGKSICAIIIRVSRKQPKVAILMISFTYGVPMVKCSYQNFCF